MPFYDGLLKAIGIPTEQERIDAAGAGLMAMARSKDPADQFGAERASSVAELSNGELRKAMPRISGETIPPKRAHRDGSVEREMFVAKALRDYANQFMEHGDDGRMAPPLGRAVRNHAVRSLSPMTIDNDLRNGKLMDLFDRKATEVGRNTEAYLAVGKPHEKALDEMARIMPDDRVRMIDLGVNTKGLMRPQPKGPETVAERQAKIASGEPRAKYTRQDMSAQVAVVAWTRDALAIEVALARGGALRPDQIVRSANDNAYLATFLAKAAQDPEIAKAEVIHPNFQRGQMAKGEALTALIDRHMSTPEHPITKYVDNRQFQGKQPGDREASTVTLAPTRNAAVGAMRDKLMGNER